MPVYTSNEDYDKGGKASPEEKKAYQRIYHEALKKKMSAGSVCVYIVAPDGPVMDSKTVPDTKKVLAMLEGAIEKLQLKEGRTLVEPRPQSTPPKAESGALTLHLSAPYDNRRGSWHEFPAESWLVFTRAEWERMLPSGALQAGASWDLEKEVSLKLLNHFYPATEDTRGDQVDRNVIEIAALKGTIESVREGKARGRMEGAFRMKRPFYPGHPEHKPVAIEATIVGFLEFPSDRASPPIVRLVTDAATFNTSKFGVAVRSVP